MLARSGHPEPVTYFMSPQPKSCANRLGLAGAFQLHAINIANLHGVAVERFLQKVCDGME